MMSEWLSVNELADELEIAQGNNNANELIPEAIAMLRQQQAEIEALKESLTEAQQESLNWEDRYRSIT